MPDNGVRISYNDALSLLHSIHQRIENRRPIFVTTEDTDNLFPGMNTVYGGTHILIYPDGFYPCLESSVQMRLSSYRETGVTLAQFMDIVTASLVEQASGHNNCIIRWYTDQGLYHNSIADHYLGYLQAFGQELSIALTNSFSQYSREYWEEYLGMRAEETEDFFRFVEENNFFDANSFIDSQLIDASLEEQLRQIGNLISWAPDQFAQLLALFEDIDQNSSTSLSSEEIEALLNELQWITPWVSEDGIFNAQSFAQYLASLPPEYQEFDFAKVLQVSPFLASQVIDAIYYDELDEQIDPSLLLFFTATNLTGETSPEVLVQQLVQLSPEEQYTFIDSLSYFPGMVDGIISFLKNPENKAYLPLIDNDLRRVFGLPTDYELFEDYISKIGENSTYEQANQVKEFLKDWDKDGEQSLIDELSTSIASIPETIIDISIKSSIDLHQRFYRSVQWLWETKDKLSDLVNEYEDNERNIIFAVIEEFYKEFYEDYNDVLDPFDREELSTQSPEEILSWFQRQTSALPAILGTSTIIGTVAWDTGDSDFRDLLYQEASNALNAYRGTSDNSLETTLTLLSFAPIIGEPIDYVLSAYDIYKSFRDGHPNDVPFIFGMALLPMVPGSIADDLGETARTVYNMSDEQIVAMDRFLITRNTDELLGLGFQFDQQTLDYLSYRLTLTGWEHPNYNFSRNTMNQQTMALLEISEGTWILGYNRRLDDYLDTGTHTFLKNNQEVPKSTRSIINDAHNRWFPRFGQNNTRWYRGATAQHAESHAIAQAIDGLKANNIFIDPNSQGLRMVINRPPCISRCVQLYPDLNMIGTGQIQDGLKEIQKLPTGQHIQYLEIHFPLGAFPDANYELVENLNVSVIRVYSNHIEAQYNGVYRRIIIDENGGITLQ